MQRQTYLNLIAIAVYSFLPVIGLLLTFLRYRQSPARASIGRALLCFVAATIAMALTSAAIGGIVFALVLLLTAGRWSLGAGFLFAVLGPALAALFALPVAVFLGRAISRRIWPSPPASPVQSTLVR